jgi:hypothetical protein
MAQRFAGVAFVSVDGQQLALRGNLTVSSSAVERNMIAGQDGVHGYQELPRVPWIEADFSTIPGLLLEDLEAQVDVTVIAQLANQMQYTLTGGTCKGNFENNARDGQVRVRWEGLACQEITL